MQDFSSRVWFDFLNSWQQNLVKTTNKLCELEDDRLEHQLHDYSFLIFPMAKAYEGFIKKYLFDLKLIDKNTYESKRFRIGRAINPDVRHSHRDQYWLYDDLSQECGEAVARDLWEVWLKCRNRVFHYFPKEKNQLTYKESLEKIKMIDKAMTGAVTCMKINGYLEN